MARTRASVARLARAGGLIARDRRIPRPVRWAAGFGALPIPGPVDELVLIVVAPLLWIFWREPLREAWRAAA